ncbi:unnamed protein product [Diamesa serratosioi]
MANILKKTFLESNSPFLLLKRFRGKINIQRPRAPHYERAKVIAVTTPIYPEKKQVKPCLDNKIRQMKNTLENPYEVIIAREVKNWFNHSQMIGIFHLNPISAEDFFKARVAFHKNGMELKKYGKSIMDRALTDSKFEASLELFSSKTCIIFSTESKKVSTMLKIAKKVPQMHLLSGVVEDRLLSKNEFTEYANMPDITMMRAQFVSVLNMASSQLVKNLESHQSHLVTLLDAHVRVNQIPEVEVSAKATEALPVVPVEVTPETPAEATSATESTPVEPETKS